MHQPQNPAAIAAADAAAAAISVPPSTLADPSIANTYFTTLLTTHPTPPPPAVILSWLAGPADYFLGGGGSTDVCAAYLRCVSTYADCLVEVAVAESGDVGGNTVISVARAAGRAATKCRDHRGVIASSGIIATLSRLATCWETAAKQKELMEDARKKQQQSGEEEKQQQQSVADSDDKSSKMKTRALTPYHAELMRCCILAGHYRYASSFAESHPVNFVGPMRSMHAAMASASRSSSSFLARGVNPGLDPVEVADAVETYLTYFYYLGMVYIGCEDLELAAHCFRVCVVAPSQVVSAISIAARKKLLLCQCLLVEEYGLATSGEGGKGKSKKDMIMELPAASSPCVGRYMSGSSVKGGTFGAKTASSAPEGTSAAATSQSGTTAAASGGTTSSTTTAKARQLSGRRDRSMEQNFYHLGRYHDIVIAYLKDNAEHLDVILQDTADLLAYDGNLGLAKRIRDSMSWKDVAKTVSIYKVVALEKVVSKDGDCTEKRKKAESLLLEILQYGGRKKSNTDASLPFGVKIDQESGMVYFPREGDELWDDDYDEEEDDDDQLQDMATRVKTCMSLAQRVRELDTVLSESNRYQRLVISDRTSRGLDTVGGKTGGGSSMPTEGGPGSGPMGVADLGRSSPMDAFD
uniref:COP9 signalosome complex subunit 3 N-terminal helical repeats domain-containing protein n=2 Tax=Ditylum brightwellii TaxID=49249 RepID=A0A7S4QTU7_9STRA